MENYINNITFQIKLQSKEIILLACHKFTNAWKFIPIIVVFKIIHYNRCNFTQSFFTVQPRKLTSNRLFCRIGCFIELYFAMTIRFICAYSHNTIPAQINYQYVNKVYRVNEL